MFEKVAELLKEQLDLETVEIRPDSSFKEGIRLTCLNW